MYDKIRVGKLISDLERYFEILRELKITKKSDLHDQKNFYSSSMVLFSILNITIDLGEEIISANNLGVPETYKDVFRLLGKRKLITSLLQNSLGSLVYYRNLLAHEYQDFTEEDLFNVLVKVNVIKEFIEIVKNLIKNETAN